VARQLDPAAVRAYLARDWSAIRAAKRSYWRARLDRGGLAEAARVSEQLRVQAQRDNPTWPTEQDREEDLESHQRVAQALRSTAARKPPAPPAPPAPTTPKASARARARRIRQVREAARDPLVRVRRASR
jgi:hypothetical protein